MTTTPDRSRERKACDAIARCIEELAGVKRSGAFCPEEIANGQSEIDYTFDLDLQKYALEHTVIEAFDGQLRADDHFAKFVGPIEAALDRQLPRGGYFQLLFPIDPSSGMRPAEVRRKQSDIIAWARTAAYDLAEEVAASPAKRRRSEMSGKTMPDADVTLYFYEDVLGVMGSRLMAVRKAPRNYEELRVARIHESIRRKCPKLEKWKPARTVLVLENRDMALSNHWVISDTLELGLQGRSDVPDEVWLVDGVHSAFWIAICLRKDSKRFPHEDCPVRFREFKPSELSEW
jgi:hypothetical protein